MRVKHWPSVRLPVGSCVCGLIPGTRRALYKHVAENTPGWMKLKFFGKRRDGTLPYGKPVALTTQAVPGHWMTYWRTVGAHRFFNTKRVLECSCNFTVTYPAHSFTTYERDAAEHRRQVVRVLCRLDPVDCEAIDRAVAAAG